MSRVYVKNLAKNTTEQDIRDHFKNFGNITDVKLCYRNDGEFKRIAFIGFYDKSLKEIQSQFDNTYLKSSKISIYEALSHEEAISQNRKRGVPFEKKEQMGSQQLIKKIYDEGGEALQQYLKFSQQKSWQNEMIGEVQPISAKQVENPSETQAKSEVQTGQKQIEKPLEKERDPTKLKLKNLPLTATEQELTSIFTQFGPVHEAIIAINPISKQPSGIGYVTFKTPNGLQNALKKQEVLIQGKYVLTSQAFINEAPKDPKREYFKRAFDKYNQLAWNATAQSQENITSQISKRLGVDKQEIQQDAVIQATGEALLNRELLEQMEKIGLMQQGVRSKTAILVKNLPEDVTEPQMRQIFNQYGTLVVCDLFFQGFCLVQFSQPSDARRAFTRQAFRKVGKGFVPMMLEWAILKDQTDVTMEQKPESENKQQDKEESESLLGSEQEQVQKEPKKEEQKVSETRSIHVKSVAFTTDQTKFENTLRQTLKDALVSCNLVTGMNGHKGYGFAVVHSHQLEQSIQQINKIICDGFKWEAQESVQKKQKQDESDTLDTNKLIIKNLAFQASSKELRQLLQQFGRVVSFRAPKKLDNTLRGFAFVEYATEKEATEAMKMLQTTHFYGRHLVAEASYDKEAGQQAQDMM